MDSKQNKIDSLKGWGSKDGKERGSKSWEEIKLQMFNPGRQSLFKPRKALAQIKSPLSSRIQPHLPLQLLPFFSESPRSLSGVHPALLSPQTLTLKRSSP